MTTDKSTADTPERRTYRKVYRRLWANPQFLALTDSERLMALYILAGPQTNRIGLFKFNIPGAADDLKRPVNTIRRVFHHVRETFGWLWDADARVIWIQSWWKYNPLPKQDTNLRGLLADINEVPSSPLIAQFKAHTEFVPAKLLSHFIATSSEPSTAPSSEGHTARATYTYTETETNTETETARAPRGHTGSGPLGGSLPREHLKHAWCGNFRKCVPEFLHGEFVRAVGGDSAVADATVRAFYERTMAAIPDEQPIGDETTKFWRPRFAAAFPAPAVATAPPGRMNPVHAWEARKKAEGRA